MVFPRRQKITVIFLVFGLVICLALVGYFFKDNSKSEKKVSFETSGIRVTTETEEREYYSLFGEVKEKKGEDTILIENEGEEEWVRINPDNILTSDYEQEGTANPDGSRGVFFKMIPFSELSVGDKVTIYNLISKGGSTLHGEKVMVWKGYYE